jgi:hypothetical protein
MEIAEEEELLLLGTLKDNHIYIKVTCMAIIMYALMSLTEFISYTPHQAFVGDGHKC